MCRVFASIASPTPGTSWLTWLWLSADTICLESDQTLQVKGSVLQHYPHFTCQLQVPSPVPQSAQMTLAELRKVLHLLEYFVYHFTIQNSSPAPSREMELNNTVGCQFRNKD